MKEIARSLGISALALYFTQQIIPAILIQSFDYFIIIGGLLFLANFLLGPVTKILFFLPINYLVIILLHILANILVFYFASQSFEEFQIGPFSFAGFENFGVNVKSLELTAIQTTMAAAVIVTVISAVLRWLLD